MPKLNPVDTLKSKHPEIAAEWHPTKNGNLTPDDITYGSGTKVWWLCKEGHEYMSTVLNRSQGQGCPECARRRRAKKN